MFGAWPTHLPGRANGAVASAAVLHTVGRGFESLFAHHLIPISELKQGEVRKTSEKDFATLCSNCHRMIHKLSDPSNIEKLKAIIQ